MAKRKAIGQKVRFEVFKRDSFTCQYCGKSAPTVVLNVDHLTPVAAGGDNSIMNLVTSCFDCNSGKSDRALSDHSVVSKQMDQLKLLNERKEQLKMIADWRSSLAEMELQQTEFVRLAVDKHLAPANRSIGESYLKTDLKTAISKYGLDEVLSAVEKSANQYLRNVNSDADRDKFLTMIPRICYWSHHEKQNPEIAQIRKIAYSANKKWWRCNPQTLTTRLLSLNRNEGLEVDELYTLVMGATGIMAFEDDVAKFLEARDE